MSDEFGMGSRKGTKAQSFEAAKFEQELREWKGGMRDDRFQKKLAALS